MEKHVYRGPRSLKILQWQPGYNVQLHFRLAQNLATRQMDLDSQLKTFVIPRYDMGVGGNRGNYSLWDKRKEKRVDVLPYLIFLFEIGQDLLDIYYSVGVR